MRSTTIKKERGREVMKYVIDRFEGEFAVVELSDKKVINIPKIALPQEAKEGSVIDVTVDFDETAARLNRVNNMMNDLFK